MKKKIVAFILSLIMLIPALQSVSIGYDPYYGYVEFYDTVNTKKDSIGNESSLYAKLYFKAPADGDAVAVIAKYDTKGILQVEKENIKNLTPNEKVEYKTSAFSVYGISKVKVFIWDDMENIVPLVKNYGVIEKSSNIGGSASGSAPVKDKEITTAVTLEDDNVQAYVPAGTKVTGNNKSLTLTVTELANSTSGIKAGENEVLLPLDIHVDGIAEDNTVPVIVTVTDTVSPGLNKGNLELYHVENGETVKMEEVNTLDELTKHNQFHYDALTGTITLAMATFSEVAVVADTTGEWKGNFDYTWYDASEKELTIANADQLAAFGKIVGGMADKGIAQDSFKDKTVILAADVNLADDEENNVADKILHPIGYYYINGDSSVNSFEGTFDGNGHTISNFYQNTWEIQGDYDGKYYKDAMGLFGYVVNGTVKNLTVDNFSSDGEYTPTGVIAAYAVNSTFENIAITNCNPRVYNTGNGGIVGIGGNSDDPDTYKLTFNNITIDNSNKISALWGSWDVACGGLVGMFRGDGHVWMTNCHVAAQIDVYNDVCGNYQYYWYRYSGMMVGTNKNMKTDDDGYTVPETDKFHAENCTVHFGEWNNYWYCELVANTLASYTHDHQFSRLEQVDSIDIKNKTITVNGKTTAIQTSGRCNYVVINDIEKPSSTENATCYHFVDGEQWTHDEAGTEVVNGETVLKENNQHIYLPFNQLFTGYGWGVKHIPVGEFNGVTILDRAEANSVVKFESIANDSYTTESTVTIGDLFESATIEDEKLTIKPDKVQVTVSPANETSTAGGTYVANTTDWTQGTLTFSGTGAATITIQDYYFCTPTTINVEITERVAVKKFESKFTGDFLYRVGNQNAVKLDSLFKVKNDATIGNVSVTVDNIAGNADGGDLSNTTLTNGEIQFTGTGVVKVTITDNDYCIPTELILEVVGAKNVTTASFSGNTVLLNDVSTSSTLGASGVVYGNGFTVNMENAPISEKNGAVFHLYDGAILKNLGIVGKEFATVAMNVNDTNYGVSAVRAWGTVTIENCYISGCRSAVSVTGTELTIKDSVIANGVYANIDFRSGILNLHNVTTINEPHTVNGTTVVGLGIVGNMTASAGRQINITGNLTQYNWVSQTDCSNIKASSVDSIFESVFTDSKYASLRYTYNGTTYVNTGVLSLCSDFGSEAASGIPSDYSGMNVTATIGGVTVDGYVWAPAQAGSLTATDMKYHGEIYKWSPSNQGTSFIAPAFGFANAGLEQDNGVVQISYESGSSYTLTANALRELFKPQKYGKDLSYTVSMNGIDYTDKNIVFDAIESNTYTIKYTVTDNLVYDKMGQLTKNTHEIVKELKVFATVVDKGADAPTFTFYYGTNGKASAGTPHTTQPTSSYTSTIKQFGEEYYIMPNVNATSANAIGSKTVDGTTVYYPIVDGINVRSGNSADYDFTRYYPIFKALKISDNGTEYSYSSTKEMPATVSWVSEEIDKGNGASSLNDGFGLYNNQYLCKIQKKAGDAESGGTSVVKYSYTALDGNTYNYYVGYRFYDESEGCITPETLITLADGTKKQVQNLTDGEELLVWNLKTGKYDSAPIVFNESDAKEEHEIIHLYFADGSDVEVIYEHGFFDVNLGEYVYIRSENAKDYIGHEFVTQGSISNNTWNTTKLANVVLEKKISTPYSPVTFEHLCYYTDGVLSMPGGIGGMFNIFEVDTSTMKYDSKKMARDIENYGLFTYEDFKDIIPEFAYEAFNGQYLKVAIGKGHITWEDILRLAERYGKYFN